MLDFKPKQVRASTILTGDYVAGEVIESSFKNQMVLLVNFTKGNLASAKIKIEFSYDGSTYFQETLDDFSSSPIAENQSERSFTADGRYVIQMPFMAPFVKVSAIGVGADATGSLMAIDAIIGVV